MRESPLTVDPAPTMTMMDVSQTEQLPPDVLSRLQHCERILRELERAAVAISGGMDSSFLLALAVETLGVENILAITAVSTIFPQREVRAARDTADQLGVQLIEMPTEQLADPHFAANPTDRCYYCKSRLFSRMKAIAEEHDAAVVSGANIDDTSDYRPGARAEEQLQIRRPLLEASIGKRDIRTICKARGWDFAQRPSSACLASRIPYGQRITQEGLRRIDKAEEFLHRLGYPQVRVRDHGPIARIEVPDDRIDALSLQREQVVERLVGLGWRYVTLDLQGFRSGSLNPR